ncbi:uncharacterized protein LOC129581951 isoform X2 [Paramacrobiotus metropolitanus]|nr:uncharacterized protein LOC129581951 isoform X2 [Paramacrobiotus metropolitanus]
MASDSGEKIYAQFAQSKCYVKAAPNSAYPDRKSAILRSAVFRPNGCVKLQTSFWYRMSAAPILTGDRDKDYFLELVMHHSADNSPGFIPTWQIWGSTSDYADFPGPNVWNRVQTEYAADDQFTLNFYAHHGDTCNTTSIDLDGIDTKTAVVVLVIGQFGPVDCRPSPTSSSSATSTSTTTPESVLTTTPEVHTHEPDTTSALPPSTTITPASEQCEVGPAVIARCSNGKVSMPSLQPDLSDANTAVFAGDNSYLCRTHLRSLQMWLLEKATKQLSPHKPVEVTCRRGVLEFSQSDPDTADAMVLQFRAVSVDMKCRIIFADFLAQLISVSASFY